MTDNHEDLGVRIVYYTEIDGVQSMPKGIRDDGGFLLFFPTVLKYEGQNERYEKELLELNNLAEFLISALQNA